MRCTKGFIVVQPPWLSPFLENPSRVTLIRSCSGSRSCLYTCSANPCHAPQKPRFPSHNRRRLCYNELQLLFFQAPNILLQCGRFEVKLIFLGMDLTEQEWNVFIVGSLKTLLKIFQYGTMSLFFVGMFGVIFIGKHQGMGCA